jgi:hypothetical protein
MPPVTSSAASATADPAAVTAAAPAPAIPAIDPNAISALISVATPHITSPCMPSRTSDSWAVAS